jgi:sugar phosphate isomerase/epimerase
MRSVSKRIDTRPQHRRHQRGSAGTDFRSKESQVAVGEGLMPVRGIFESLIAIKYAGFVDLEYEVHADDPMPGVIGSLAYMRGVLAGMGFAIHS